MKARITSLLAATSVLALALPAGAERRPHRSKPLEAPAATASSEPAAPAAPTLVHDVTMPLSELASSADALRLSTQGTELLAFTARADQLLTAATLDLALDRPAGIPDLQSLEIALNGEPLSSIDAARLGRGDHVQLPIDPGLLASNNALEFRYGTRSDPAGCGRVPSGAWEPLARGSLRLRSASLPLPTDLEVLPLPFFDPNFDREQTIHFVFGGKVGPEALYSANLVASWFAMQGSARLSFAAHLGSLPKSHAVFFIDDFASAQALGLPPTTDLASAGLELRQHPTSPSHKVLLIWGLGTGKLTRAARRLLRDGHALSGPMIGAPLEVPLPELAAGEVPRWVKSDDVVLGSLPENPVLRAEGGTATTLRIPFRVSPDAFDWPREWVELDLGYTQSYSPVAGPAHLHVALNGLSVGVLPQARESRSKLRVSRSQLRGFNELLVQISYPDRRRKADQTCGDVADTDTFVQLQPDSKLHLGTTKHFSMLPDLNVFLYDGFPFTEHGDLRQTMVILPSQPLADEIASMLAAMGHLATITGHAPTGSVVMLGAPDARALEGHDALLIAGLGRHPLLEKWSAALPLATSAGGAVAQHPAHGTFVRRLLTGRVGKAELTRAQQMIDDGPFAAVMGVVAPWDPQRSLVVMTASPNAHIPPLASLLDYADAVRQRNDLLVLSAGRRALFQLGSESGRGELPSLLALRWWLAHYWVVLLPLLLLAALAGGLYLRITLGRLGERRLSEIEA
jgi:hypothetical protein